MSNTSGSAKKPALRRLSLILVLAVIAVAGWLTLGDYLSFETLRDNREALLQMRNRNLALFALGFVAVYVAIVAFSLPGAAVASMTGGFLFGLAAGTGLNVLSATVGAALIFLAARWGLGAYLAARMESAGGRVKAVKQALHENEAEVLLLIRLVPAVPFFVANLLPALAGVRFVTFLWTTALGIIPGALVFTWIGVGLGEVFDRGGEPDMSLLWEPHVIGPVLGLCALAALPIVLKAVRGRKGV